MNIKKQLKSKIEKKTEDKYSPASIIKERLEMLKEKEKQEAFKSEEFQNESTLYGFDSKLSKNLEQKYKDLSKKLKQKYKDVKLEEHFTGNEIKNDFGKCYSIVDQIQEKIKYTDCDKIKMIFLSELRCVKGIGDFYEKDLKRKGYKTIDDLLKHDYFHSPAKEFKKILDEKNGHKLLQWLERRYPKTHKLVFLTSSFYSLEDFIFIDIESMGLHGYPLFLIGTAYFKNNHLKIEQLLARDMNEEAAVLAYLNEKIKEKNVISSYNGKTFDIPVIKNRMNYYNIEHNLNNPHYDIYQFSKSAFKERFTDFKLTTLESQLFNMKRKDHIPSYLVPDYYEEYLSSKNIGTLVPIIEHNKQDLISTVQIFGKLHELWG